MTKQTLSQAAQYYASNGAHIFRLSPNAKIPIAGTRGFKDATTDDEVIEDWWRETPDANIGLATEATGVVVIDVDLLDKENDPKPNPWMESLGPEQILELSSGAHLQTGSGGAQFIFRCTNGRWKSSGSQFADHVDVRCAGGYIVMPPSTRGSQYQWVGEEWDGDPHCLPLPPQWVSDRLDEIQVKKVTGQPATSEVQNVGEGGRNNYLTAFGGQLRNMGMSHHEIEAAIMVRNMSHCRPPLGDAEVQQIARSVARYEPNNIATQMATGGHGVDLSGIIGTKDSSEIQNKTTVMPKDHLYDLPNEGGEFIQAILDSAPYPNRPLAFGAALVAFSGLLGRKWAGPFDTRANLEMICLADSGVGKDHPRKMVGKLYSALAIENMITGATATKEGLEDFLTDQPCAISLADEADGFLQSLKRDRSDQSLKIWNFRLELYSSSSGFIKRRVRAGQPGGVVHQPFLSVFSTAIPELFYGALTMDSVAKGLLSRSIVFEASKRKRSTNVQKAKLSPSLIAACQRWTEHVPVGGGNLTGTYAPPVQTEIPYACPWDYVEGVRGEADNLYEEAAKHGNVPAKSLWNRAMENTTKLAMIRAALRCGPQNHPAITQEDMEWAKSLVWPCIERMLEMITDHMSEDGFHARKQKVVRLIKQGKGKVSRTKIMRSLHLKAREMDELMHTMMESGEIELFYAVENGGKKHIAHYRAGK